MTDICYFIGTSIVIILGWMVVHWLSVKRDELAQRKLAYKEARKLLSDIENKSLEFHCSQNRNKSLEKEILKKLDTLDFMISCMEHPKISSLLITDIRSTVTLKNFQVKFFVQQPLDSDLIRNIGYYVEQLDNALLGAEFGFHKKGFVDRVYYCFFG